ncbi:murein transglycosylase A [Desulfatibacillum aliphaticivorans]|uniref:murein transglycosylase A n=1 Tax=Desulfatibacillum aliphaticivorans TaxID=218208 RepID=UPI000A0542FA|nr:MltA domain-containing protein [Desulfatibacillum aliphaticivorans]
MKTYSVCTGNLRVGRRLLVWAVAMVVLLWSLGGCGLQEPEKITAENALKRLSERNSPRFNDDAGFASLRRSIASARAYLEKLDPDRQFTFGPDVYPASRLLATLDAFEAVLDANPTPEELNRQVSEKFLVYQSVGSDGEGGMLFTGYYEPLLEGTLEYDPEYQYPLYGLPEDLVCVNLGRFKEKFKGEQICGRLAGNSLVPYYTREEIDSKNMLEAEGLEIAWVKDPVDLFFLHVQGSGRIKDKYGHTYHVHYAGKNGQPYRSIGKLLIDEGVIEKEAMSMQALREYLENHPEDLERVFNHNPSYVFFDVVDEPAIGYAGQPLEGGRAAAVDHRIFPMGALAFVQTEQPAVEHGVLTRWEEMNRFVLTLDTGGAIRGAGRMDFFWGNGDYAEIAAGHMKQDGRLFFLVVKEGNDA